MESSLLLRMRNISEAGYNERLFGKGIRARLHLSRFYWVNEQLRRLSCSNDSVFELGCFDGKLIEFLPHRPISYLGIDANWEGGLDIAKKKWHQHPEYGFHHCSSPADLLLTPDTTFDIAVVMETLEHLSNDMVRAYLKRIAEHTKEYIFVTIPNEKGIVFLAKWAIKKIFSKDAEHYSFAEIVNATLGRMDRVQRKEHKGFDYNMIIRDVREYFDVVHVSGIPFSFLPISLNFGVGIVGKKRY